VYLVARDITGMNCRCQENPGTGVPSRIPFPD
jgi:hypothetical protein